MKKDNLVAIEEFCFNHGIEVGFISSLEESGLIEITSIEQEPFIEAEHLRDLEKFIRFYYDFDINLEGIETITHLLHRINSMQDEIILLRNRLRIYESNESNE